MGDNFTDSAFGDFIQNITGLFQGVAPTVIGAINPQDAWRYGIPTYNNGQTYYASQQQQQTKTLLIVGAVALALMYMSK